MCKILSFNVKKIVSFPKSDTTLYTIPQKFDDFIEIMLEVIFWGFKIRFPTFNI